MNAGTEASVYLKAAMRLERGLAKGCCGAVCETVDANRCTCGSEGKAGQILAPFKALFMPEVHEGVCGYWWDRADAEARVVALCFMAAMVEAGDA